MHHGFVLLTLVAPRMPWFPNPGCLATPDNQSTGPFRILRGEHASHRSPFGSAEHHCCSAPGSIHDRANVVGALFKRCGVGHAVGHPSPAFVEPDKPAKRGEWLVREK